MNVTEKDRLPQPVAYNVLVQEKENKIRKDKTTDSRQDEMIGDLINCQVDLPWNIYIHSISDRQLDVDRENFGPVRLHQSVTQSVRPGVVFHE